MNFSWWPFKQKKTICPHLEWRALGYGRRDPDTGKYLGRACVCTKCGEERLFIDPPKIVWDW